MKKPVLKIKAGTTNTLVATWEWKKGHTASYDVYWTYATGNKDRKGNLVWFVGNDSSVKVKNSEYTIPNNAIKVRFKVKPIATTHKVKKKDKPWWTADWSGTASMNVGSLNPPSPPSAPSFELNAECTKVTASLSVDPGAIGKVIFQIQNYTDKTSKNQMTSNQTVQSIRANGLTSVDFNLLEGKQYRLRAMVVDKQSRNSGWSEWTEVFESSIDYPLWKGQYDLLHSADGIYINDDGVIADLKHGTHEVLSYEDKQLKLSWVKPKAPKNLEEFSYEIEWTKDRRYFNMGDGTTTVTVPDYNRQYYIFTGDDFFGGEHPETYFRIRSKNGNFVSKWNTLSYGVKVGLKPAPPTTWTSASAYSIGDKIIFYWIHNSEDGAKESEAELTLKIKRGSGVQQTDSYTGDGIITEFSLTETIFGNNPTVLINGVKKTKNVDYIYDEDGRKVIFNAPPENGTNIEIRYYQASSITKTIRVVKPTSDEVDSISQYTYDTNDNPDILGDTEIEWFVKTTGAGQKSDASISRSIKIWTPPVIEVKTFNDADNSSWLWDTFNFRNDSIYTALRDASEIEDSDILGYYPFFIYGVTGPITQKPIRYVVSISANETYETPSVLNDSIFVNEGEEVYSVTIDPNDTTYGENIFWHVLTAGTAMLANNVDYTLKIYAMMDSGLSAEFSKTITTAFADDPFEVDADILIDEVNLSASILPRAFIDNNVDNPDDPLNEHYDPSLVIPKEDVILSVYRRNHDGTLTLIADDLDGSQYTTVFDLHPPLNFAIYRIVAIDKNAGKMVWADVESEPIEEPAIIIQWNEESSEFHSEANNYDDDELASIMTPSSMLRLPWNIKVNDGHSPDVSLVEYIGRSHPVSYYGTQKGETSTWSTDIDKEDEETLYNIRRLAIYPGDVYVREPSGTGYWANITVSYDISYDSLIIPVTFNITKVEGGA